MHGVTAALFVWFVSAYRTYIVYRFSPHVLGPRPLAWLVAQPAGVAGGVGMLAYAAAVYVVVAAAVQVALVLVAYGQHGRRRAALRKQR